MYKPKTSRGSALITLLVVVITYLGSIGVSLPWWMVDILDNADQTLVTRIEQPKS